MKSEAAFAGQLDARLIRPLPPAAVKSWRIPGLGRVMFTRDPGEATLHAQHYLLTRLHAVHRDGDGAFIDEYDLGSGLVTNMGVLAMCNDFAWSAQLNLSTLGTQNFVATGTGATAAAATDFRMQTLASPTTTTAVTGAQSLVAPLTFVGPTSPIFRQTTTVNYTTTLAITEWGLHSQAALSSATGSPSTAAAPAASPCWRRWRAATCSRPAATFTGSRTSRRWRATPTSSRAAISTP
jgi:hypothetical protein